MQYVPLGRSQLQVSRLCLGTMMFGGPTAEREAHDIVALARERGVNFIDTADVYNDGAAETIIGAAIRADRDHWVVATKIGNAMSEAPNTSRYSLPWMQRECEASLRRLTTDAIDIYYLHRDFNGTSLEDPLRGMERLWRDGKIRYWGLSNFRGWRIAEAVRLAGEMNLPAPVVCQPYYNLLNRQPEVEVLPACLAHGLGVVPYSPIARGVLTGKYAQETPPPAGSRAARQDKRMLQTEYRAESFVIAQQLKTHGEERGVALTHFACAWVLAHRAVTSVIAGPRTLEQWRDYFGALDVVMMPEDEAFVDTLVAPGHSSTPGYNDPAYPLERRTA